jgi:hypothetical protein
MSRRLRLARSITVAFFASVLVPWAAAQQTERKPPRRLPPTGSQTTGIPAGVDSGTPATSDSMPLGTPVPPAVAADRNDQNKRSAAARAAARPASAAASAISETAAASEANRPVSAASAVRPARSRTPSPPAR